MAEQAAQEAAMRFYEESLREAEQKEGLHQQQLMAGGFGGSATGFEDSVGGGVGGMVFDLAALQAINDGTDGGLHQQQAYQQEQPQMDMLQELMGMPGANLDEAATVDQLLQALGQQRQQQADMATSEESMPTRPEKHFLTIARQDGKRKLAL